jgi:hypothetical protein
MKIVSSEYLQNMLCTQIVFFVFFDILNNFGTQHVLQMLRASEKDIPVQLMGFVFCFFPALTYTVNWEADENGFRADAPHLPQPVAIPFPEVAEAVEAQLRFAASQPAYVEPAY